MSPLLTAIVAAIIVIVLDRIILAVCIGRERPLIWCRVALFATGFMISFIPITIFFGLNSPMTFLWFAFGIFTGFSNSLSIDLQRAYFQKRAEKR